MNSRVSIAEDNRARFAAFFGLFFGLVESPQCSLFISFFLCYPWPLWSLLSVPFLMFCCCPGFLGNLCFVLEGRKSVVSQPDQKEESRTTKFAFFRGACDMIGLWLVGNNIWWFGSTWIDDTGPHGRTGDTCSLHLGEGRVGLKNVGNWVNRI